MYLWVGNETQGNNRHNFRSLRIYFFAVTTYTSNQDFLDEVRESVSGPVESILLCKVSSLEVPKDCMTVSSKQDFIRRMKEAKKTHSLSHAKSVNKFMLKIISTDTSKEKKIFCFIIDEYVETKDLYFSRIDAGRNCSNAYFRYLSGNVKIEE